jgi:hypothetical protein
VESLLEKARIKLQMGLLSSHRSYLSLPSDSKAHTFVQDPLLSCQSMSKSISIRKESINGWSDPGFKTALERGRSPWCCFVNEDIDDKGRRRSLVS